jgi:hypothetical protein
MIVIIFIFLILNIFIFIVQVGQPMWRWNFDLILLGFTGIIYNLAILTALLGIKDIKKKLQGEK